MKILHTSDWHFGKIFYNNERSEEFCHFIKQLKKIVKDEQPDVLIVCGDVYDIGVPSNFTKTMFVDAILDVHNENPSMEIVITAGNHDSGSGLEVDKQLWKMAKVHIVGNVKGNRENGYNLDDLIIKIGQKGYIIAVPYISLMNYPILSDADESERIKVFYQTLQNKVKTENSDNLPVIMMAHLTVSPREGESEIQLGEKDDGIIGGIEAISLNDLGDYYDYLALGHIHHPQFVGNSEKVCYSGSVIPVNFDETFEHSVCMVEIQKHNGKPKCRRIPLTSVYKMLKIHGTPEECLSALNNIPTEEKAYVRCLVSVKDYLPADFIEKANEITAEKQLRYCGQDIVRTDVETTEKDNKTLDVRKFLTNPLDVALDFYRNQFGEMDDDIKSRLKNVIKEVAENETEKTDN